MNDLSSENSSQEIRKDVPIIVVCAADDKYAMPLAVTVRSAIENLKGNYKILLFILDGGIKNKNKQRILKSLSSEKCNIRFLSIPDELVRDFEESHEYLRTVKAAKITSKLDYISIASYYRLIISEILPEEYEKLIYLDSDLVVKGDIGQLWQTDLAENYVLAAQDTWIKYVSTSQGLLNYQELGIPVGSKYFNAGVLVINLKKWRTDRISSKAISYLKQNKDYVRYHDQDVLNALFANRWGELDPRWNLSATNCAGYSQESPFSEDVYNTIISDPYILHYTTEKKPWTSRHTLCKEYFFNYVDMTAWSGWRLTIWRRVWLKLIQEFKNRITINFKFTP